MAPGEARIAELYNSAILACDATEHRLPDSPVGSQSPGSPIETAARSGQGASRLSYVPASVTLMQRSARASPLAPPVAPERRWQGLRWRERLRERWRPQPSGLLQHVASRYRRSDSPLPVEGRAVPSAGGILISEFKNSETQPPSTARPPAGGSNSIIATSVPFAVSPNTRDAYATFCPCLPAAQRVRLTHELSRQ